MTPDADAATVAPADLSGGGLRELGGPEAIGRDWRRFWRLLRRMTRMDWANRYQGSVLGYAWTLLGPLLYSVVLYFAFSRVLRFGGDVQDYQAVLILDIMLFSALTGAISRGLVCFISRSALIRQIEIPRLVLPLAAVATATITLCFNLVVVLGIALVMGVEPTLTWLLLPVIVGLIVIVAAPATALFSVLNARMRDVSQVWAAIGRALFFASPVIVPIEAYPKSWDVVLEWNPLAVILAQARVWIIDPTAPSWADVVGSWSDLVYPITTTVIITILAIWAFRRLVGGIAEEV